jgi:hypothetical protein
MKCERTAVLAKGYYPETYTGHTEHEDDWVQELKVSDEMDGALVGVFDYEGKYFIYFLNNYEVFRAKIEKLIIEQTINPNYIDSLPNVVKFVIQSEYFAEILNSIFEELAKTQIFDYQIERLNILFSTDFAKTKIFVHDFIDKNFNSKKHLKNLFLALIDFDWNTKHEFLIYLINKNASFELFSELELRGYLDVILLVNMGMTLYQKKL